MNEVFKLAPHEWAQLRALLDEALALPASERAAWLRAQPEARAGALKPRLESMLATAADDAPATAARLLETLPKVETGQFAPPPGTGEKAGDTVGPHKLVRELGSGGMGSVRLAERTDLLQGRQVALKLPHLWFGAWKRAGLAERLAREREILATLEHPNIARLYDAGVTPEGQPWLALEYVAGERIDAYCRAKRLPVKGRLALFLQVARAVAHAHAQLVVHRDLKPANILVTEQAGEVKLLDFGIAKLVAEGVVEETELTRDVGRAFTPEYASPEQILGRPLGTASDVYSLGVVLFELLAEVRPYKLARSSRAALEEAVAAADVPRPSVLAPAERRRAIRGDLDTIVLKALKREPAERYATVAALADDIQRHLAQRPVLAQPDSAAYRLRSFLRRNRLAVAAGTVAVAGVLAGSVLAVWQAVAARAERDQALLHERRASNFADFMRVLLQDAGHPDQPLTPSQMLDRGVAMLERRELQDDALAAHMWLELSRSYLMFKNIGREVALLERSAAAARRVGDFNQVAAAECSIASSMFERDREQAMARLEAGRQALAASGRPSHAARGDCVRSEARLLQMQGRVGEAVELLQAERQRALQRDGKAAAGGLLLPALIESLLVSDRAVEALPLAEETLQETRAAGRQGSLLELVRINTLATVLARVGEYRRSAEAQADLIAWVRRPDMRATAPTGVLTFASAALLRLGRHAEALDLVQADQALLQASGNPTLIAINHLAHARALTGLGRLDEARQALDAASAQWSPTHPGHARLRQEAAMDRAELLLLQGEVEPARQAIGAVLAGVGYPGQKSAPGIDRLLRLAARAALQGGRWAEAEALAADAAAASRHQSRGEHTSGDLGIARSLRARALAQLGRADQAAELLRSALPALSNGLGDLHAETLAAREQLQALTAAPVASARAASN